MTSEEKRKLAETITRHIVVREKEVEFDFIYLPTLEAMGKSVRNQVLQPALLFLGRARPPDAPSSARAPLLDSRAAGHSWPTVHCG
jgi:hypothetical protein